jgi:predicted secreted protein
MLSIPTIIALYLTIWWTVLFAILPIGSTSYAEAGIEVTDGGDPGAPVNPNLKRKFITTTWVAAIVLAVILGLLYFHVIDLTKLPLPRS